MTLSDYDRHAHQEMRDWQAAMRRRPTLFDRLSRGVQMRVNAVIPERVHAAVTTAIKQLVRGVLFGATHTSSAPLHGEWSLVARELRVQDCVATYRGAATLEGAATGAAGFLVGMADFPILLGIKLKLLFEIAALYGHDTRQYPERLYLLHLFQLAYSSRAARPAVLDRLENWEAYAQTLPADVHAFDWRTFQQEYRDYIDLAKLAQLLPVVGAAVGAVANYRLITHLGEVATQGYRMRLFGSDGLALEPPPLLALE